MKFEIGEIAIIVLADTKFYGLECEIISALYLVNHGERNGGIRWSHDILIDGLPCPHSEKGDWAIPVSLLRKKRPPQEVGSWKELKDIWQPDSEVV